jgi:hypothetical protein
MIDANRQQRGGERESLNKVENARCTVVKEREDHMFIDRVRVSWALSSSSRIRHLHRALNTVAHCYIW